MTAILFRVDFCSVRIFMYIRRSSVFTKSSSTLVVTRGTQPSRSQYTKFSFAYFWLSLCIWVLKLKLSFSSFGLCYFRDCLVSFLSFILFSHCFVVIFLFFQFTTNFFLCFFQISDTAIASEIGFYVSFG